MTVIRVEKKKNYSIIPNAILKDKRLTVKARFMLIFCLSLADTWDYNIQGLATSMGCGRDAVITGLKELEEYGYLVRKQIHAEKGKFAGYDYTLYEQPYTENPYTDSPYTEKPYTENPTQINTKEINTNNINNTKKAKAFIPPTVNDVKAYIASKGYNLDAENFVAYYEANDWKDSNNKPVKNWKQRVVSWAGTRKTSKEKPIQQPANPVSKVDMSKYDSNAIKEDDFFDEIIGG